MGVMAEVSYGICSRHVVPRPFEAKHRERMAADSASWHGALDYQPGGAIQEIKPACASYRPCRQ